MIILVTNYIGNFMNFLSIQMRSVSRAKSIFAIVANLIRKSDSLTWSQFLGIKRNDLFFLGKFAHLCKLGKIIWKSNCLSFRNIFFLMFQVWYAMWQKVVNSQNSWSPRNIQKFGKQLNSKYKYDVFLESANFLEMANYVGMQFLNEIGKFVIH